MSQYIEKGLVRTNTCRACRHLVAYMLHAVCSRTPSQLSGKLNIGKRFLISSDDSFSYDTLLDTLLDIIVCSSLLSLSFSPPSTRSRPTSLLWLQTRILLITYTRTKEYWTIKNSIKSLVEDIFSRVSNPNFLCIKISCL